MTRPIDDRSLPTRRTGWFAANSLGRDLWPGSPGCSSVSPTWWTSKKRASNMAVRAPTSTGRDVWQPCVKPEMLTPSSLVWLQRRARSTPGVRVHQNGGMGAPNLGSRRGGSAARARKGGRIGLSWRMLCLPTESWHVNCVPTSHRDRRSTLAVKTGAWAGRST